MKKAKTILLKGLFYLIALQILNLSIDMDYLAFNSISKVNAASFDDLDSVGEYILEKILGDSNFTSEMDDDEGSPQSKGIEKYDPGPFYAEQLSKPKFTHFLNLSSVWVSGLDLANKTSKGYFIIVIPPPKV